MRSQCKLIFSITDIGDDRLPTVKKVEELVACEERDSFSDEYYNSQERSRESSVNISIPRVFLSKGKIFRLEYKGKKYDVKRILKDKQRGIRFIILDCDEVKLNG